jgi:hypothetical protein
VGPRAGNDLILQKKKKKKKKVLFDRR